MGRSALPLLTRLAVALIAGGLLAWIISACGSSGSGTVSQRAQQAASSASSQAAGQLSTSTQAEKATATGKTTTATQPPKTTTREPTTTVTQPAQSTTVTKTETRTAAAPAPATSVTNQTTSIQVTPTSTTTGDSSGGVPWWGWLLIALGVIGLALAMFLLGRRRRGDGSGTEPSARLTSDGVPADGPRAQDVSDSSDQPTERRQGPPG
jgi:cobalamin biosynthesis Mg chelatase CobN